MRELCLPKLAYRTLAVPTAGLTGRAGCLLGGSGDLVSKVISTLIGVISNYKYSYLSYNPSY